MALGALAYLFEYQNYSVCNSGLGQLGQAFSRSASRSCTYTNLIWLGGVGVFLLGVILLVAGLILVANHQRPETPAPGWYPDPQQPAELRYWDGDKWTPHTRRRL